MRINKIKLSGFKSFVDPTTLTLPGDLTGVVGPNGCGKSNVIDAMIWVLGESSAKHLRGDSMTDVIFNGSNTRKPVGQAVVEIVFDNSDRTIAGQYAAFSEISIKRVLGRDAISNYYLNGTRCRRKDITNVFLGTGIGPRSYSVIEQGMISRIIEAKPEELRAFLEEAAGISKYKERRRETESRISHTEENIERLNDIREELDKQLRHLKRQASAAEKYKTLKSEERKLKALSIVQDWQEVSTKNDENNIDKEKKETLLESANASVSNIEARLEESREKQVTATEAFNKHQSDFYSKSSEISRIEQSLAFAEEREQGFEKEILEVEGQLTAVSEAISIAEKTQVLRSKELEEITPQLKINTAKATEKSLSLKQAETDLDEWRKDWDEFNLSSNEAVQAENSLKIRIEHLTTGIPAKNLRKNEIAAELKAAAANQLNDRLAVLRVTVEEIMKTSLDLELRHEQLNQKLSEKRVDLESSTKDLHIKELSLEKQKGELGSLKAVVEKELGGDQEPIVAWFEKIGMNPRGRLADLVEIDDGWELAVEAALRVPLNAFCGDGMVHKVFQEELTPVRDYKVTVLDTAAILSPERKTEYPLLSLRVSGPINMQPFLDGVYTAESEGEALIIREHLAAHELVVTKRGAIFARNWAQLPDESGDAIAVLALERQIHELEESLKLVHTDIDVSKTKVRDHESKIVVMENSLKELVLSIEKTSKVLGQERERLNKMESDYQVGKVRLESLQEEMSRINSELELDHELFGALNRQHEQSQENMASLEMARSSRLVTKNKVQQRVDAERESWSGAKEEAHSVELSYESLRQATAASLKEVDQSVTIRETLAARLTSLKAELALLSDPRAQDEADLETALTAKLKSESVLTEARSSLESYNDQLGQLNNRRNEAEEKVSNVKSQLENIRLEERTYQVQLTELMTRFKQTEEDFDDILDELGSMDGSTEILEQLEKISGRIIKLEPINLAAIDEFNELSERKTYLDSQDDDLMKALSTLKGAIRKIDGETKARFKETYDNVNEKLQGMFPVLFGGGKAYLEMTEDDLLNAGVTVMARPPGKRNSSIHLLSGGEKALTALAFVFSIFELNPAPFCLLDEVDAPLDDANVARLTELLKSMSETVQFLFVTHNKITMEIAEQLIGVTMQEAGVSRLVSVNIDKAVELAATA